ncbi:MAG: GIY-YIG nuclease family protein [Thermodesulfovibrionales bacterium]
MVELADLPAGRQARNLMTYYVYVIRSTEKKYIYVGLTNDPERRIIEHNSKKERTTRSYAPFKTILIEEFGSRVEARRREKYLKSGIGKEYLKSF